MPDIVSETARVMTVLVAIATYLWSQYKDRKLQRANFIRDYTNDFYRDERICSTFFDIDFGRFAYSDSILKTQEEINLACLLDLFNSVGFHWSNKIIDLDDIDETTLGYAILRAYESTEVMKYLDQIDQHQDNINLSTLAYRHFTDLGHALSQSMRRSGETSVCLESPK